MESRIYSIYDVKTGMYGPAMTFVNDATAIRSFMEMMTETRAESLLSLYPTDYVLFCLGIYHQDTGKIESLPAPMNILSGGEAFTRACVEANDRRARAAALAGKKLDDCSPGSNPVIQDKVEVAEGITSNTVTDINERLKQYD